jgi:hypothetical protein
VLLHQGVLISVGNSDPDLNIYGPPGSRFGSISQRYGSGPESFLFGFFSKVLSGQK